MKERVMSAIHGQVGAHPFEQAQQLVAIGVVHSGQGAVVHTLAALRDIAPDRDTCVGQVDV